jgi:hypothetical protein
MELGPVPEREPHVYPSQLPQIMNECLKKGTSTIDQHVEEKGRKERKENWLHSLKKLHCPSTSQPSGQNVWQIFTRRRQKFMT